MKECLLLSDCVQKNVVVAGEMAQRVKADAAEPDNPSSIPRTNIMEGEN